MNKDKVLIITPSEQITIQIQNNTSILGKTFYEKIGFEIEEAQNFVEDPLIVLNSKDLGMEIQILLLQMLINLDIIQKELNYPISKTMLIY